MAKKWTDIERSLRAEQREVDKLEKKRLRSMATIFAAQLENQEPPASEVEFFKVYTNLIDLKRQEVQYLKSKRNEEKTGDKNSEEVSE